MKNIKFIISFSAFGFVLSFVFGLFSRSGFGHIILFALIFAIVFAGIGFGLQFLFDKVLDINTNEPVPAAASENHSSSYTTGQKVDIVVEDQDIPEDMEDSQFFVGTNHQMLNDSDFGNTPEKVSEAAVAVKAAQNFTENQMISNKKEADFVSSADQSVGDSVKSKIASENSSSAGFVPISLGETPKNFSGTEARPVNDTNNSSQSSVKSSVSSGSVSADSNPDELDVLPDLEDISFNTNKASSEANADEDGDIVPSETVSSGSVDAATVTEGQDAAVMAKAISTLLAKDR